MSTLLSRSTALIVLLSLTACGPAEEPAPEVQRAGPIPAGATMPPGHPPIGGAPEAYPQAAPGQAAPGMGAPSTALPADARTGTAKEVIQAAGYTYVRMDFDGEELWVAGPSSPLNEGDVITVSGLMGMTDFYARSLDRTFDAILFANTFSR